MLVRGARVPQTNLVARKDVSTAELMELAGPRIGELYHEYVVMQGDTAPPWRRRMLELLEDCFEVYDAPAEPLVREFRPKW